MPADSLAHTRRLALAGMFAGLAWGAGYVDSIPNFEFLTVILFVGGWVLGPFWGAVAGALGEFLYSAINPYGSGLMHPLVLSSQVAGMALSGAAGGWLGRHAPAAAFARWAAVALAGVLVTLVFDALTNLASGAVYGQWKATLLAAIPFAAIHVGTNAALFATVGVLLVNALERTRRSLLVVPLALVLCAAPARAQAPVSPAPVPAAPPAPADSLARPRTTPQAAQAEAPDSTGYRDATRAQVPPAWGDGPATLLRRDDGSLAEALTHEGGFSERFADDRGSAEPLGRFGLAGPNRVLVDWLGMPLTSVGALGGETARLPWNAVAVLVGPTIPVSSTEAFRGELGAVTLEPFAGVHRHPRVEAWAGTGKPGMIENGFTAAARLRRWDGFVALDAGTLAPLAPLGPTGHHSLATRFAWDDGRWSLEGAYRSARTAVEDSLLRSEWRRGEAGRARIARAFGAIRASLAYEGAAEGTGDTGDEFTLPARLRGKGGRGTVKLETGRVFGAFTYGRETLEREGAEAFDRAAKLWWGAAGGTMPVGALGVLTGAVGAGRYGEGGTVVAPSLRLDARDGGFWAGAGRGLSAALDTRLTDDGDTLRGDREVARRSTWLGGVGWTHRSSWERAGGAWRGPAPRGALSVRTALWAGRSTPSSDPSRTPLASAALTLPDVVSGASTRFVAWTGNARWSPLSGLTLDGGGFALGRVLSEETPADPEARAFLTLEGRHRFGADGVDARLAATGEWIGARDFGALSGTTTRFGLTAQVLVDEFELRARWSNLAGTNRFLPVDSGNVDDPLLRADERRLHVEVRWTFWD